MVFITSSDTTVLRINTFNMDLGTIKLTGSKYSFNVWNNEEKFIEQPRKHWKPKFPFEYYVQKEDDPYYSLNKLVRVELVK